MRFLKLTTQAAGCAISLALLTTNYECNAQSTGHRPADILNNPCRSKNHPFPARKKHPGVSVHAWRNPLTTRQRRESPQNYFSSTVLPDLQRPLPLVSAVAVDNGDLFKIRHGPLIQTDYLGTGADADIFVAAPHPAVFFSRCHLACAQSCTFRA